MPARQPANKNNATTQATPTSTPQILEARPFAPQPDLAPEAITAEAGSTQTHRDRTARVGHHLAQLAINTAVSTQSQPIQAKISISPDTEQQLFENQLAIPSPTTSEEISQRVDMPEDEELQMKSKSFGDIAQRMDMPEDEELQMRSKSSGDIAQRMDMPEEEELQMKSKGSGDIAQRMDMPEDEELQMKTQLEDTQQKPNNTGLSDQLKQGVEQLSGMSLDDVNVHFNSSKPSQINAHAYAQGTDIHLAPGQEQHLPHEAWHVAQQKQGRVKPTQQLAGAPINDDPALEKEADEMGAKALQGKGIEINDAPALEKEADEMATQAVQRKADRKLQNSSAIAQRHAGVIQRANYPNLDGPVDANSISETQYGTGDGQVTFPGIDSCIGIVGRSGSSLTGVHMVMVDAAGTFMVEGSGFDEIITATAASVVSVLGSPEEIRVFGEASDWKDGIPSFFKILGGATGKLSYAGNAKGDITVTWDETAGWSS